MKVMLLTLFALTAFSSQTHAVDCSQQAIEASLAKGSTWTQQHCANKATAAGTPSPSTTGSVSPSKATTLLELPEDFDKEEFCSDNKAKLTYSGSDYCGSFGTMSDGSARSGWFMLNMSEYPESKELDLMRQVMPVASLCEEVIRADLDAEKTYMTCFGHGRGAPSAELLKTLARIEHTARVTRTVETKEALTKLDKNLDLSTLPPAVQKLITCSANGDDDCSRNFRKFLFKGE